MSLNVTFKGLNLICFIHYNIHLIYIQISYKKKFFSIDQQYTVRPSLHFEPYYEVSNGNKIKSMKSFIKANFVDTNTINISRETIYYNFHVIISFIAVIYINVMKYLRKNMKHFKAQEGLERICCT